MLKKLFGKKESAVESVMAPLNGKIVDITDVPDPVFSQKMMGEGIAIDPIDGMVVSPIDGKVIQVFKTKHAIGLKTKAGLEIFIHIGLETVNLNGEGFTSFVKAGDKVSCGDPLIQFDLPLVEQQAASAITPIILTNMNEVVASVEKHFQGTVQSGQSEIMTVNLK